MIAAVIQERVNAWIQMASIAIEILAVAVIVAAILYAAVLYLWQSARRQHTEDLYQQLKLRLGKSLLLGLEILVAATVVRTIALDDSLNSVAVLGAMVLVRTFLGYCLFVEVEGRWPWAASDDREETTTPSEPKLSMDGM